MTTQICRMEAGDSSGRLAITAGRTRATPGAQGGGSRLGLTAQGFTALESLTSIVDQSLRAGTSSLSEAAATALLDEVRRALAQGPAAAYAATLGLLEHLAGQVFVEPDFARGGLAPWQMRKVDGYLRENLQRTLRVDDLAALIPFSVSYFCRAFKQSFGTTPHRYLVLLRLERAQQLMLTTPASLSDIALACGLADQAHLSRLFRQVLGTTPRSWRRLNQADIAGHAITVRPRDADGARVLAFSDEYARRRKIATAT